MDIGKRIELFEGLTGVNARIKTLKDPSLLLFLPVWLAAWTFGGVVGITTVLRGDHRGGFLIVWLCAWFVGEVSALGAWLWNAFGREAVSIGQGLFTYKRELFGCALTNKEIPVRELSNLRAAGFYGSPWSFGSSMAQWGITGGTVAVDQGWDTHRFGIGLEETEAVALVSWLRPYLPETPNDAIQPTAEWR